MKKYIGNRYVPKIYGEWDRKKTYEPLSIVIFNGNSYTSKTFVPNDIAINNELFWAKTGNLNAVVEQYKKELELEIKTNDAETKQAIAVERARINNFGTLTQGSTTGDAELIDAHVDDLGRTHDNIGTAFRERASDLDNKVNDIVSSTVLYSKDSVTIDGNGETFTRKVIDFTNVSAKRYTVKFGSVTGNMNNNIAILRGLNASGEAIVETNIYISGMSGDITLTQECTTLRLVLVGSLEEVLPITSNVVFTNVVVYSDGVIKKTLKDDINLKEHNTIVELESKLTKNNGYVKSIVALCSDGYEQIDANYVRGLMSDADGSILTDYQYCVSTLTHMLYDRDVQIRVRDGFWFVICTYDANNTMISRDTIKYNYFKVSKGTDFRISIRRIDEDETELADIDIFKNAISIKTITNDRIDALVSKTTQGNTFAQRKPLVTIIDDDGYVEFYNHLRYLMINYKIPICTAYEAGDHTELNPQFMDYHQLHEIAELGSEILGHGANALTSYSVTEAEQRVAETFRLLRSNGFEVNGYVYPYGESNKDIREFITKYCKFAFSTSDQQGNIHCNYGIVPNFYITRCNAGGFYDLAVGKYANYNTHSIEYFKAIIDETIEKNGWLVLMTHVHQMIEGQKQEAYKEVDQIGLLQQIIQYIQSKDIEIVTASKAFETFGNAFQAGDYLGYWNTEGLAINKLGQYDIPISRKWEW